MSTRAVIAWLGLLLLALANAAVREAWMTQRLDVRASHALSSVTLAVAIFIAGWLVTPWVDPRSRQQAWAVGILWLALTLAFEFLAGHFAFRQPWSVLLSDFDVAAGRLWVLVLAATLLAPVITFIWHTAGNPGATN